VITVRADYGGCPTGHPLTGYSFTVTGAGTPGGTELGAEDPGLAVELDTAGTVAIFYVAHCEGGVDSPTSSSLELTVI